MQIKQDQNWEECEREDVVDNLFKVLYATVDDDVIVDDDGNIVPAEPDESGILESNDDTDVLAGETAALVE